MLAGLYLLGAVVKDIPMPARYGTEVIEPVPPSLVV